MKIQYNQTLAYSNNANYKIAFKGVSLNGFDEGDKFDYLKNNTGEDEDVAKKFEIGLKKIKETCTKQKEAVSGFFKKKKKEQIQREADREIKGYLKAQQISLETQNKVVELLQEKCSQMELNNADKKQLEETRKALVIATKIRDEKIEFIASNKNKHRGFNSIAGYENEKLILSENFIDLIHLENAGQDVEIPNAILFFGPIGNGKTSFAKAFAHTAGCNFTEAKSSKTARGKEEREKSFYDNLIANAKVAQQNFLDTGKRTLILVDEIDRFAYEDSSINAKLKRFLETCSNDYHCTIFATTNNPLLIPSAIRGPKRMPVKVSIDPPNEINAALVFEHYLKDCDSVDIENIDFDKLAQILCSVQPDRAYNNSQIENICNECIENCDTVTESDLIYYINREAPGIDRESMLKYKEEKEQLIGDDE